MEVAGCPKIEDILVMRIQRQIDDGLDQSWKIYASTYFCDSLVWDRGMRFQAAMGINGGPLSA